MINQEFKSFNDIINRMNLTLLEHGYLHAGEDWQFYDLASPFNRMYFVIEGNGRIYNEMNEVPIEGGRVYLIPMGETFNYVCDDNLVMFYFHFRIEMIAGNDLFDGYKYCVSAPMETAEMEIFIEKAKSRSVSDLMACKGMIYEKIARFIEPISEDIIDHVKLKGDYALVYEYVKNHCYANMRIKDIADYLRLNPSTLSKGFKNKTGMTLKSYIDGKLIEAAQERLLVTEETIKDIAYKLKFSDEFHFSRFFKRHVGLSPSVYRVRNNTYK